jgi:hypothetical protein
LKEEMEVVNSVASLVVVAAAVIPFLPKLQANQNQL